MTEQEFRDKYYGKAKEQTLETLPDFLNDMLSESHSYGSICCAVAGSAIAAASASNKHKNAGITGFQAGAVMWEFIRQWMYSSNKCGLSIIDYDNMLYPQHADHFERTISSDCWDELRKQAKESLKGDMGVDEVRQHWQSIVDGKVPFGYTVKLA